MATKIIGTAQKDRLTVTESKSVVKAGKGNDVITVSKGDLSAVWGEDGNDEITLDSGVGQGNRAYGDGWRVFAGHCCRIHVERH